VQPRDVLPQEFASLLIQERRLSAELEDDRGQTAEDQMRAARPRRQQRRRGGSNADFQQALWGTRTPDPFLTMEVLYRLS
jgi:hypothetical protein